jgi:hypothetical protein
MMIASSHGKDKAAHGLTIQYEPRLEYEAVRSCIMIAARLQRQVRQPASRELERSE